MTTRRKFIQGAVSAAVASSLPGGDGVALYSATHPALKCIEQGPRPVFLPMVGDADTGMFRRGSDQLSFVTQGRRIHQILSSLEEIEIELPKRH